MLNDKQINHVHRFPSFFYEAFIAVCYPRMYVDELHRDGRYNDLTLARVGMEADACRRLTRFPLQALACCTLAQATACKIVLLHLYIHVKPWYALS